MPAIPAIIAAVGAIGAAAMNNKSSKDAAKSQSNQNASDRQFQVDMANQARTDVTGMYPQMQQNAMLGGQAALTTMNNAFPQQTYARQQGTQNAIAALLGGQGSQIKPNFDFMPRQMPNYQTYQAPTNSNVYMLAGDSSAADSAAAKQKEQDSLSYRLNPKNAWSNPNRDVKKLIKKLF